MAQSWINEIKVAVMEERKDENHLPRIVFLGIPWLTDLGSIEMMPLIVWIVWNRIAV